MKKLNENIEHIIKNHKRIAVVGLSDKPYRSSFGIALLMQQAGYQIIPVNPNVDEVLGEKSYPSLLDIPGDIDLVDVFRRAEEVDAVVDQAIQKGAKALWMQSGIVNHTAAQKALEAGMDVVMDRCWGVEYRMNPAVVNA